MSKRTYISADAGPETSDDVLPPDPELEGLVGRIAELASERKAQDPVAVDLRGASAYTDAFVILTGNTDRQVKAIHDAIHEGLKHDGERRLPRRVEGVQEARWILLDYGDVVVHVFVPETRDFYRLESLWGDRPRFDIAHHFGPPEPASGDEG
ncbi:Iojap protein [Patulibacter medicamentivorans]|jgi:ribosome-associated protein|uniref:Ribosomal silencing factor RsfS n=1 Tax=Patulibacter medicamentivorans TaxID=1097667 RepID=H0E8M1_9ACTN|nr:ribosome silencing factor [Patulibacter medicamentivorans]EHN10021.1 Iojap protein [Patulibacter medicamentivorans]